jgi:hypothetical protein
MGFGAKGITIVWVDAKRLNRLGIHNLFTRSWRHLNEWLHVTVSEKKIKAESFGIFPDLFNFE